MLDIRYATPDDLHRVQALYQDFCGENMTGVKLNKTRVNETVAKMVLENAIIIGTINGSVVAACAGYLMPCGFADEVMFVSMFLYVQESCRSFTTLFIQKITEMLKCTPATRFVLASPAFQDSEKYDRYYRMIGFTLLEKHFWRPIPHDPS